MAIQFNTPFKSKLLMEVKNLKLKKKIIKWINENCLMCVSLIKREIYSMSLSKRGILFQSNKGNQHHVQHFRMTMDQDITKHCAITKLNHPQHGKAAAFSAKYGTLIEVKRTRTIRI